MTGTRTLKVTARLSDGRLLVAHLDPAVPEHRSPLKRALNGAGLLDRHTGGDQPGQTPDRPPP